MASSPPDVGSQVCRLCGVEKPPGDYYARSDSPSGKLRRECKACYIAKLRAVGEKRTPQDFREGYLRTKFGITQGDFDRMFSEQDGRCAVCALPAEQSYKGLHIDHDHDTGRVRGLLCQKCNMAIGLLGDDVARLSAAITYLSA